MRAVGGGCLLVGGLGLGLFALAFAVKAGGLTCFDVLVVGMATALALGGGILLATAATDSDDRSPVDW